MTAACPVVTIGVMTHNYAGFIAEAVESVLAQTRTDWEMVICDDASTDDTAQVIAPYLADPRICYHRHTDNLGQAGNWDWALRQGTAPIVCVLHADDAWLPDMLALALAEFESDPDVDMVFGNWQRVQDGQQRLVALNRTETLTGHEFYRRQVKKFTCLPSGAFLTRRVAQAAGSPDPSFPMLVDYEYFLRVGIHARRVRSLGATLFRYRLHSQSATQEGTRRDLFNAEMERLPLPCAEQIKNHPDLRPCLSDLRRNLAATIFSDGRFHAARGRPRKGLALMRRGIRMWPRLLLRPRTVAEWAAAPLIGSLRRVFLSSHGEIS